ncbi:MAG: TetR/AcrR family transcriptional regulator [Anaerolineae bacterium]|nr:TetR/AcrR family transcriptional regulator [Anaerolineae bacterium]
MSPRTRAQYQQIRRQRRAQILSAARQVFAQQGFHDTKMSDIAQAAEVSQGTLYHYFSGKDDLFMSLFSNWAEQLEGTVQELPAASISAADKLRLMGQVGHAFLGSDRELLPVFVEYCAFALHNPRAAISFRDLFQTIQHSMAQIIDEGIARGEFKPVDTATLSALPLVVLDGLILVALIVGRDVIVPEQVIDRTLELVFDGLLTEDGASRP